MQTKIEEMSFRTGIYKPLVLAVINTLKYETDKTIEIGEEFRVYHIIRDDDGWLWGITTESDIREDALYVLLWDRETLYCELVKSD